MTNNIMKDVLQQAENVASSSKGVLIIGEYGSGKGWLAKKIHHLGNRCNKPFMTVDCRILDEHEAFKKLFGCTTSDKQTGTCTTKGVFEQAKGGTVFFECFSNLSERVQKEVVKVEQTSRIRRVGHEQEVEIEQPRIICSIEIKANHMVRDEPFLTETILTNDPYIIGQPPLRQRREDIAPLIRSFLNQKFKSQPDNSTKKVSPEVIYRCIRYNWPGNVKQLKNAIEHAAITSDQDMITSRDLPISIKTGPVDPETLNQMRNCQSYKKAELNLIKNVLTQTDSVSDAADRLGIDRSSLEEMYMESQTDFD